MRAEEGLLRLGYELLESDMEGRWPSRRYLRSLSNGYHNTYLAFDTYHGGPWTVEAWIECFYRNEQLDWTTQELRDFNPLDDWSGGKGEWYMEPMVFSADECMAIADLIGELERMKRAGRYA